MFSLCVALSFALAFPQWRSLWLISEFAHQPPPLPAQQRCVGRVARNQALLGKPDGELSGGQKLIAAAAAGAASGLIACPSELIIIQQQRTGHTLGAQTREFFASYAPPSIYRGLVRYPLCVLVRFPLYVFCWACEDKGACYMFCCNVMRHSSCPRPGPYSRLAISIGTMCAAGRDCGS
jgi:hypothetical protein